MILSRVCLVRPYCYLGNSVECCHASSTSITLKIPLQEDSDFEMKTFEFHSFRVGIQLQTVELEGWNNTGCTQYMQFSSNPGDFLQSEESQRVFWDTLANGAVKRALIRDLSIREYVSKLKH
eukprot:PhF_6_TR13676/c0_g1_i2/m.21998